MEKYLSINEFKEIQKYIKTQFENNVFICSFTSENISKKPEIADYILRYYEYLLDTHPENFSIIINCKNLSINVAQCSISLAWEKVKDLVKLNTKAEKKIKSCATVLSNTDIIFVFKMIASKNKFVVKHQMFDNYKDAIIFTKKYL